MGRLSRLSLKIKPLAIVERICQHLYSNTTLTHLELDNSVFKNEKAMAAMEVVGKLLCTSSTLQVLNIKTLNQGMLPPIVQALHVNESVQKLTLDFPGLQPRLSICRLSEELTESILYMLESNRVLEQILIATPSDTITRIALDESTWTNVAIPFYLKLNQAGRKILLQENPAASKEDWVDKIVKHKNDPSVVFYFLSRNPLLLIQDGPISMVPVAPRPVKRRRTTSLLG